MEASAQMNAVFMNTVLFVVCEAETEAKAATACFCWFASAKSSAAATRGRRDDPVRGAAEVHTVRTAATTTPPLPRREGRPEELLCTNQVRCSGSFACLSFCLYAAARLPPREESPNPTLNGVFCSRLLWRKHLVARPRWCQWRSSSTVYQRQQPCCVRCCLGKTSEKTGAL